MKTRGAVIRQAPGNYEVVDLELDDPRQTRSRSRWSRRACATPTTTWPPATSRSASTRSPAATRAPASSTEVGPNTPGLGSRRPRRPLVPARLRPLPLVRVGHAEPVRPRRQRAHRLPRTTGSFRMSHRRPAGRPDVRHLHVLRETRSSTSTRRQDRQGHPAREGLPARLRRRHRLGLGGQLRRGRTRATPSSSWASAASASTPCRAPAHAGATPRHRRRPGRVQAREGRGVRRHPRRSRPWRRPTEFAQSVTNGQGADSAIVTVGVTQGRARRGRRSAPIRKAGTVVVTGLGNIAEVGAPVPLAELTLFQKRIQGSLFGASNPRRGHPQDAPAVPDGQLKLDELITRDLQARRHQPGLRGHARRQEPARRDPLLRPARRGLPRRAAGRFVVMRGRAVRLKAQ